jgi:hypothetical protein
MFPFVQGKAKNPSLPSPQTGFLLEFIKQKIKKREKFRNKGLLTVEGLYCHFVKAAKV